MLPSRTHARAGADLESFSPPRYDGDGSKEAALAFAHPLTQWAKEATRRFDSAIEAYAAAARPAPDGETEMALIVEALDLGSREQKRFLDAAAGSMPTQWKTSAGRRLPRSGDHRPRERRTALLRPLGGPGAVSGAASARLRRPDAGGSLAASHFGGGFDFRRLVCFCAALMLSTMAGTSANSIRCSLPSSPRWMTATTFR